MEDSDGDGLSTSDFQNGEGNVSNYGLESSNEEIAFICESNVSEAGDENLQWENCNTFSQIFTV